MLLETLSIRRVQAYESGPKGGFKGEARFKNEHGAMEVYLTPEASQQILEIVKDQLVEQAKRTGQLIAGAVIENTAEQPKALPEA